MTNIRNAFKQLIKYNLTRGYCPYCVLLKDDADKVTVSAKIMLDRKWHAAKTYLKCSSCNRATPAYKDINKAIDNWEDVWIDKEAKLFD